MLYQIILYIIGILFALFGALVILYPAKFTKKDSKDLEAAVKKTKRYGMISLCVSMVAIVVALVLTVMPK